LLYSVDILSVQLADDYYAIDATKDVGGKLIHTSKMLREMSFHVLKLRQESCFALFYDFLDLLSPDDLLVLWEDRKESSRAEEPA
jgi:hypothetical protein